MTGSITNTRKVKVAIYTFSKEIISGYMFLRKQDRIQDLLNDTRTFIPLMKITLTSDVDKEYPTIVINKSAIERVEEV